MCSVFIIVCVVVVDVCLLCVGVEIDFVCFEGCVFFVEVL